MRSILFSQSALKKRTLPGRAEITSKRNFPSGWFCLYSTGFLEIQTAKSPINQAGDKPSQKLMFSNQLSGISFHYQKLIILTDLIIFFTALPRCFGAILAVIKF